VVIADHWDCEQHAVSYEEVGIMIVTKKAISRRMVLRGMGAAMALPFLDGMVPAFAAVRGSAAASPLRFGTIYVPAGVALKNFWPATTGPGFEFTPILEPLKTVKDSVVVLGGLANREADSKGNEGVGDHSRAGTSFLSGAHAKKTDGPDMRAGTTLDQIVAQKYANETQLPSLELTLGSNEWIGSCDPGYACPYSRTISWRSPTTPLPMENDPRVLFERLFGDVNSTDPATRLARIRENRSILDSLLDEVRGFQRGLGAGDRRKLTEYVEAVRDIERRIQRAEEQNDRELLHVERPGAIPVRFDEHAKLLLDLQLLAFQSDLTRVFTLMMGYEGSDRAYPEIGVPDGHHSLTHNIDPIPYAKVTKINRLHMEMVGYFLERIKGTPDGDGSLLDHTVLLYGSGISNGNTHSHVDVPVVVMGGGNRLKGGQYIRYTDLPLANLHQNLFELFDVPLTGQWGDSTGTLDGVTA
jgi:hypothetical protein